MIFWRRHWQRFTRLALGLMVLSVLAPTLARHLAAFDPVRAAALAEVCTMRAGGDAGASGVPEPGAGMLPGDVHCPGCVAPALVSGGSLTDRLADFFPAATCLRPLADAPGPAGCAGVRERPPSRAPLVV
jgi:hypothetical protein